MRKRGARHSTIAVIPLGVKLPRLELEARMALVALDHGIATLDHLVAFFALAVLCSKLNIRKSQYIKAHAESVIRMCDYIAGRNYETDRRDAVSMTASIDVLLTWFNRQPNSRISKIARYEAARVMA